MSQSGVPSGSSPGYGRLLAAVEEKRRRLGELRGEYEAAQDALLAAVEADRAAGRLDDDGLADAYYAFRDAAGGEAGFSLKWDSAVGVSYREIQLRNRMGIGRPTGEDGSWSGPFPLPPAAAAPVAGTLVVVSLFDGKSFIRAGVTQNLRSWLRRQAGSGLVFDGWEARPAAGRAAAAAEAAELNDGGRRGPGARR